jgi:hydrogenase maturation protease
MTAPVLIVGIGNELLTDEGVGVHVARALAPRAATAEERFEVLDAGTALLDAVLAMSLYEHVFIVDAMRAGRTPGTVYRWDDVARLAEGTEAGAPLSLHAWDVADTLRAARELGLEPRRLTLFGVEPASVVVGMALSPEVERAAARVVSLLLEEIAAFPPPSPDPVTDAPQQRGQ